MSTKKPTKPNPLGFTVAEFCDRNGVSVPSLYRLWGLKRGPQVMRIGGAKGRIIIPHAAEAEWRKSMVQDWQSGSAKL